MYLAVISSLLKGGVLFKYNSLCSLSPKYDKQDHQGSRHLMNANLVSIYRTVHVDIFFLLLFSISICTHKTIRASDYI
jgi:hypothetical protein